MKKLYITPFTMMMNVELQKVIAASKEYVPVEDYTETDPNNVASRRRRRSVWDDEEDEEMEEF